MRVLAKTSPLAAALLFAAPAAARDKVELITPTGHPTLEHLAGAPDQVLCVRSAQLGSHVPAGRTCATRGEWR